MDPYTAETKRWLDDRFRQTTEDGVFYAHQNIYGFKSPYVEDGVILRYTITCNVFKALSLLRFDSLLDVGGAEGYMAALARAVFGVRVRSCDLSQEACLRARELFGIDADPVDGVELPYPDGAFDVVLCSEVLEHIPRYDAALRELLRVARTAVIVTVPHDGPEAVAENIRRQVSHGHIHDFTLDSLRDLVPASHAIRAWGLSSSLLRLPFRLVDGRPIDAQRRTGIKRWLVRALNPIVRLAGRSLDQSALKAILRVDPFLATRLRTYRQLLFIIAKDPSCLSARAPAPLDLDAVLDFKVPLHPLARAATGPRPVPGMPSASGPT